ncbi:hypothetical protein [Saccharopolyspora elongata]|uniref:Uncharacterized protein n=1 Tax=Saccharopolyspora elongata TaxID=2530387 RepID=A0A4R4XZA3_9PSEU|nr:hypothetical protein [Saccharopolyspora elongata]TDD35902.1 hypothetical protein E1288_42600 [Saccharopolyspora elongata]
MTTEPCSPAVLLGRLRECDRLLPRPGTIRSPTLPTVPWAEFCDPKPGNGYCEECVLWNSAARKPGSAVTR